MPPLVKIEGSLLRVVRMKHLHLTVLMFIDDLDCSLEEVAIVAEFYDVVSHVRDEKSAVTVSLVDVKS